MKLPRTLKFLCLTLAALLVADIAMLVIDMASISEADPLARNFIVGVSVAAIAITLLLLAMLFAFAKRVRNSMAWLQAFVIADAAMIIAGSFLLDSPSQERSLFESIEIARSGAEALVCIALAFVLHRDESRAWFARSDL